MLLGVVMVNVAPRLVLTVFKPHLCGCGSVPTTIWRLADDEEKLGRACRPWLLTVAKEPLGGPHGCASSVATVGLTRQIVGIWKSRVLYGYGGGKGGG